eukprot:scaffold240_cov369-Pavlova_lutheri.AAC.5
MECDPRFVPFSWTRRGSPEIEPLFAAKTDRILFSDRETRVNACVMPSAASHRNEDEIGLLLEGVVENSVGESKNLIYR